MPIITLLLIFIVLLNILFIHRFLQDLRNHWSEVIKEGASSFMLMISSVVIFFGSALGISDFTTATLWYRNRRFLNDTHLPGTLNTQCVLPVAVMAIAFISVISVDPRTLITCILAQMLGAYFGPQFVAKCSVKLIRIGIALGLFLSLFFLLSGKFGLIPYGGVAHGLSGDKLIFAAISLFLFGALNCIGIGSYTPSLVTLYALGLNPAAAFPIIMGAAACSTPLSSMQFIKYGQYSRKITLIAGLFGVIGALIGVNVIHQLDISKLQWLIAAILLYSSVSLFIDVLKSSTNKREVSVC